MSGSFSTHIGLENELIMGMPEKERHETWDMEMTKDVTDANVELANANGALCVVDGEASADR